ncbi:GNAT family N-acetyltransferase [Cytophagaceae bacterium DM2B3-1]|uniref:GNAT family N-acetyltransferase n=1 Tax=Xanthocytophaga flava TaxID=3048013 RepID=A0ABT7CT88_9BACT|nr:GNAT family N-acetyltransferase [Xanthocytophaga flavus]MDJ1496190.1 GNAT family N-acetyltransferase [Xanthocytophaga flavus]
MNFRNASIDDLESIYQIESICFPPNEAASLDSFSKRLQVFPQHFWLLEDNEQLIGYINGMVTNNQTIVDEMFAQAELHNDNGACQSVFGIAVLPEYRNNGYGGKLINFLIEKAKEQNRAGITLTCKEYLISYYEKFGFADLGISQSVHGGEVWHDMILKF